MVSRPAVSPASNTAHLSPPLTLASSLRIHLREIAAFLSPRVPFRAASAPIRCAVGAVVFLLAVPTQAQSWETLAGAPVTSRHNDAYFISPDTGWVVDGSARIHRTNDGGQTWQEQFFQPQTHLRSVGFLDAQRGFAGSVGAGEFNTTDPYPLYRTSDGGATWSRVEVFDGPEPVGLCGMYVVNDSTVVAVGRVRGPAIFVKTTDGGETWTSRDMSDVAAGLIDVYFPHPDTGFAVGLTDEEHSLSRGVVVATTDGGETWATRFTTTRTGEWSWKLSFPTRETGYASLQRNSRSPIYFLKTRDGGETWEEKLFTSGYYFVQGIGFIDEKTGWIGGNSTEPPYQTTDGGDTWTAVDIGVRLNRFRFLSDSLGYAVGSTVHKLIRHQGTSIDEELLAASGSATIHPNPFHDHATVSFSLDDPRTMVIAVYDVLGRRVRTLLDQVLPAGSYDVPWDGMNQEGQVAAAGTYYVVVRSVQAIQTRPVVRLR